VVVVGLPEFASRSVLWILLRDRFAPTIGGVRRVQVRSA